MSAPSPPSSAASASPARPPALAPGVPPSTQGGVDASSPTSGNIEVFTPRPAAVATPTTAPPVRQPQQDYWDEKICLEVEYNAEYPQNVSVSHGSSNFSPNSSTSSNSDVKTAAVGGFPAPDGLKRSNTNGSHISEPAPAYRSGDAFANSPNSERGMWRGDAGVTDNDRLKPAGAMLFGYPKKTVLMIAGGAALFLGIIIAIVLGVVLGMHGQGQGSANTSSPIMDGTKLTAMNWTEPTSGVQRSGVVYQHKDHSIMMATRDSLSNKWRQVNITASVMKATKAPSIDVLPGTPLAVTTNRLQHSLYYLNSQRQVQEFFTTDVSGTDGWTNGLFASMVTAKSAPGSRISAVRQMCSNCTNSLLLTWQDDDGSVRLANFTADRWTTGPPVTENVAPSTGMAISTFTDFRGTGPFGTDTNALRIYMSGPGGTLVEYINGPETNFAWASGNFGNALTKGLATNPTPDIASITFGSAGWFNNLVTYVDPKGKLMNAVWRGQQWTVQAADVVGVPSNVDSFTSIVSTQDMRLYALSSGKIHEFYTNMSNPFAWTYQGPVVA